MSLGDLRTYYRRSGRTMVHSAETALWRAVVMQAVADATTARTPDWRQGGHAIKAEEIEEARQWLTSGSADFTTVCDWAKIDVDYLRMKARLRSLKEWKGT